MGEAGARPVSPGMRRRTPTSGGIMTMMWAVYVGKRSGMALGRLPAATGRLAAGAVGRVDLALLARATEELADLFHPRFGMAADFRIVGKNAMDQRCLSFAFAFAQ